MAQPYRAFSNAGSARLPRDYRSARLPAQTGNPVGPEHVLPEFDNHLSKDELDASMDWPNWPEDPAGQMPVMQNNRQTVQAAKQMRQIDRAGRSDLIRQLAAERANSGAATKAAVAGGTAAAGAGASSGTAMFMPATTLGQDDEVRRKSLTAPEYLMSSEPSWAPFGETPFESPVSKALGGQGYIDFVRSMENPLGLPPKSDARFHSPAWTASEAGVRSRTYEEPAADERAMADPFDVYDMRVREEMYPEAEEALGPVGPRPSGPSRMQPPLPYADKPLSQGGFPSGLLRHLLTPPPQDRPSY